MRIPTHPATHSDLNRTPVLSSGTLGFILVLENVPDKAHTFMMNAVARQL